MIVNGPVLRPNARNIVVYFGFCVESLRNAEYRNKSFKVGRSWWPNRAWWCKKQWKFSLIRYDVVAYIYSSGMEHLNAIFVFIPRSVMRMMIAAVKTRPGFSSSQLFMFKRRHLFLWISRQWILVCSQLFCAVRSDIRHSYLPLKLFLVLLDWRHCKRMYNYKDDDGKYSFG